ncbi:amidohydrolase family protein [Roseobacter sp.]|uniref:amidohydrolase family protein n=1 Tax=Roseobacter sp. TaxID=1907202 RepID=UPI00385FA3F5
MMMDFCTLLSDGATLAPEVLLTPDGVKRDWAIRYEGNRITRLGPSEEFPETVALPGRAIVPGFVDAHTHVGQIFGKALIGGEPAQIWRRIWHPMERDMDEEQSYLAAKWAFWEALRGGFSKVVNYGLNGIEKNTGVHRAALETGIRLVSACGLDEFSGEIGTGHGNKSWSEIEDVILAHIDHCAAHEMIAPSVCCSSFMGNTPETLARLSALCAEKGILLQIHSNEHFPEVHEAILRHGKRPTELLHAHGVLGSHVLLHHTTLVSEPEIEMIIETDTATSYNPLASVWKGNAVAPALRFAQRGVRFGIGSDTTSADGFKNLMAAEACQRIEHALPVADFSCGAAWTWIDAATSQGAAATGGAGDHGKLAEGQAADFMVLDMMAPECLPSHDFEWELLRYYNRDQVDAMVINGRPCMSGGTPVGWETEDLRRAGMAAAVKITSAPDIVRCHGSSDLYRPRGN